MPPGTRPETNVLDHVDFFGAVISLFRFFHFLHAFLSVLWGPIGPVTKNGVPEKKDARYFKKYFLK